MKVYLGINTGFAVNRYSAPHQWVPLIADTFGLNRVQFTADLLNASLPDNIIDDQVGKILTQCNKYGVKIPFTFTSAFTRVNHLAHPDEATRNYWIKWFCKFADISSTVGAESMGSHLAILTVEDCNDQTKYEERFKQVVDGWRKIAQYSKLKGIKYLTWEPMSIRREFGETIAEARKIQAALNENISIPMKICLDVDHGDLASPDPRDTDPYEWIKEFGNQTPIMHIKQSLNDKSGHFSFTSDKNKQGKVNPEKVLAALEESGVKEVTLLLELSFREREPFDSNVVKDIKASIEYWRPYATI